MTPPTDRRRLTAWLPMMLLAAIVGACGSAPPRSTDLPVPSTPAPAATPALPSPATAVAADPSAAPSHPATVPPDDPAAAPPTAMLGVEGGDPVAGSLGTYTWRDGGSDAPWLTGAPIRVGANETLVMAFDPAVPVEGWSVRYAPADATSPAGSIPLGEGEDGPSFRLPPPGSWTLELTVTFTGGLGEAHYFWQVDVT